MAAMRSNLEHRSRSQTILVIFYSKTWIKTTIIDAIIYLIEHFLPNIAPFWLDGTPLTKLNICDPVLIFIGCLSTKTGT